MRPGSWILLFSSTALLILAACSGDSSHGNRAPLVAISSPLTGDVFTRGDEVRLEGSASDPEDGALTGASLEWTSAADGPLGSGASLTTTALSLGSHTIRLTATDSLGSSAWADVHVRVVTAPASTPRPGEVNPYAGRFQRTPAKLDDELILVGRSGAQGEALLGIVDVPVAAYEGPSSDPVEPRITATRAGLVPLAAASGRPLGSSLHQAAVVYRTSEATPRFLLELVGLADPGDDRIAEHRFQPPFPDGAVDVAVADLDAFEEETGAKAANPPAGVNAQYNDEVAIAFADLVGSGLAARIDVLSFESVGFPLDDGAPVPGPTTITTAWTTQPMHPASRVVLRHGDALFGSLSGPHLLVAYVDEAGRIAADVFEYQHTRADPHAPDPLTDTRSLEHVLHAVLSSPLPEQAVAAGGWDVVVGRGARLGIDQLGTFDFVLVVRNASGAFVEQVWKLEGLDGLGGPVSLGQETGELARVPDGAGGSIGLSMLPDARLRVALGRIVDTVANRCEAVGLLVLADTNRGPVVQSMTAFVEDPFIGSYRFGPVNPTPAWPHVLDLRLHPETDQTTRTSLASGGFVTVRNGLIDDRGDPAGVGTEFAIDCDSVDSSPFLGPMPSFYVADPERSELHAVTMLLGGQAGIAVTVPLGAAIDERAILLAADATGDAGYYEALSCAGSAPGDCRRLFLGDADLHYAIEDIETSSVVLQQPPKHVDHLRELGGIVDVSMRDGFFAEFAQTDVASGSVTRKMKTDWSIGARVGFGVGPPTPKGEEFSSVFDMSLDAEHRSVQERFGSSEVTVSLTQTTGAVGDDVVWSKVQTVDYWRFPAQGGRPESQPDGPTGFPDDAYMEIAIPDEPRTLIGPGTANESFQPTHMVGNILSYPTFSGDADDLGELFGLLGSYVPSDEQGARACRPLENGDPNGCLVRRVNGALERVAQVLAGDDFVGGEFQRITAPIDVAEVLEVGGISYSAELEFDTSVKNGLTVTNNDTIKAEANLKIPLKTKRTGVPLQFGELDAQLRASASFEHARVSENTVGSKTKIALHLPADIPVERSYRIRPSFGFTPGGGLRVSYQVNTDGAASTFWERHYGRPDPALNMPHRIVRAPEGFRLGTDFSRGRIKGFFVRDGKDVDPSAPDRIQGNLLTEVPRAGDPVQLQVQVTNLSVASWVADLAVSFSAQRYESGEPTGEAIPIGLATIDFLPYRGQFPDAPDGHVGSAYVVWDTSGFAPPPGRSLATYLVRVTLDPDDRVAGETHELLDRYGDPLLGPTGEVLDPLLEKGQNNTGWSLVRIAPPLSQGSLVAAAGRRSGEVAGAEGVELRIGREARELPLRGRVHEPLRLGLELRSRAPELDHGLLQVFDGDPSAGALLILGRVVQGIAGTGTQEEFAWRPRTPGPRVLHAIYRGPRTERRVRIPVIVED